MVPPIADNGEVISVLEDTGAIINHGHEGDTDFRSYTWVVIPCMARTLGGFHHCVVWRIAGKPHKRFLYGGWEYPPIVEALREAGIKELYVYIPQRHKMVAHLIATQTIMNLCMEAKRRPGDRVAKRLWEQDVLQLLVARGDEETETEVLEYSEGTDD